MKFNSYSFKRFFSPASRLLVFFGLAASLAACQWGDEIESLVQPNPDNFLVLFSDTSTVTTSIVNFDSVMTGSASRALVGRFEDPYFGKMAASFFIQPSLDQALTVPEEAAYDSLVLSLPYFRSSTTNRPYSYGDTTKRMNLSVYPLTANMAARGINFYFNTSATPHDPTPLGTKSFFPRPFSETMLKIRLSDILGRKIFTQAKANLLTSNDLWLEMLKGLLIESKSTDNGAVVGFQSASDSTGIDLHYHTPGVDAVTKGVVTIKNGAIYNRIIADRSNTALAGLPTSRRVSIPSSATGEKAFIQEGLGILTRIDIPYIKTLKDTKYSVSNRAFLRLTPVRNSVTRNFSAPPIIYAYLCNQNNELLGQLTDLAGRAVEGVYINDMVNNTQFYSFDVSAYVTNLLNSNREINNGILLATSTLAGDQVYPETRTDFAHGLTRLVIGSQKNASDRGVKLELYYTTVKPEVK